jgi:hypothetical protein
MIFEFATYYHRNLSILPFNIKINIVLEFCGPISDYFVLIGAYSNFDIFDAPPANEAEDWELFDPDEYVKPSVEMDVPLRYEIKPTPVMLGMARSEFYNQREYMGANRFEIIPDKALPGVEMTSFHHFIQK